MFTFGVDYYFCVLIATTGVLQIAVSMGGYGGLLIFKSPKLARGAGSILMITAFTWFFSIENRNINDYEGGLDANMQALLFFCGAFSATLLALITTSIINYRMRSIHAPYKDGLDAVRHANYAIAMVNSISCWQKKWRTLTNNCFFG